MRLSALQRGFCDWLRDDDAQAAERLGLADPGGLAVYQANYRGSLMACLAEVLPHTLLWLGEEAFEAAAATFIDHSPPSGWTLDAYPAGFPAFLGTRYPDDPEVAELAMLEWRLSECFVAPDAAALGVEDLGAVDWDRAVLRLVPSALLLPLFSNAGAIWSALAAGEAPPGVAVSAQPAPLLIWRSDFTCRYRDLDAVERAVLPQMVAGLRFSELCGHLVEQLGEGPGIAQAGGLLARWAAEGVLVRPPA